jgi:hypothetical protein
MLETLLQSGAAFYASCSLCLFLFATLLLGHTSTKVLFRHPARVSTLVLYRDGTGNSYGPNRHHTRYALFQIER